MYCSNSIFGSPKSSTSSRRDCGKGREHENRCFLLQMLSAWSPQCARKYLKLSQLHDS